MPLPEDTWPLAVCYHPFTLNVRSMNIPQLCHDESEVTAGMMAKL